MRQPLPRQPFESSSRPEVPLDLEVISDPLQRNPIGEVSAEAAAVRLTCEDRSEVVGGTWEEE